VVDSARERPVDDLERRVDNEFLEAHEKKKKKRLGQAEFSLCTFRGGFLPSQKMKKRGGGRRTRRSNSEETQSVGIRK
jgi:hypothetical protein